MRPMHRDQRMLRTSGTPCDAFDCVAQFMKQTLLAADSDKRGSQTQATILCSDGEIFGFAIREVLARSYTT